ncbi:hypothetical protein FOA52_015474 [Chlamydomonas sp. UWO 241]|nr:hypothetical protein FOA52_015474 [Chlamydomonas sp. UWO 241]
MGNKQKKLMKQAQKAADELDSEMMDEEEEEHGLEGDEAGPSVEPREPVYDAEGLHEKLEDIAWIQGASWADAQVITGTDNAQVDNIDDDLERELTFYNSALLATHAAIAKFEAAGIPWRRPTDYYAEMVKTDTHMARVKEQLMHEQKQIELAEERRKQRESKQYSKQVQAERLKEKQQDKKRQIDSVSKMRKQRAKSGYEGEADFNEAINGGGHQGREKDGGGQNKRVSKIGDRNKPAGKQGDLNKKRQSKDAKFGFGGKKSLSKQNDKFSAADMSGYHGSKPSRGGKPGGGGKFGGKPGGGDRGGKGLKPKGGVVKKKGAVGGKAPRPGKSKRQAGK